MIKKKFTIPSAYQANFVKKVKELAYAADPKPAVPKPVLLDFGQVRFWLARNFGFCWGVENAVEIAYKTLEQEKDKRVYLLSEMIHNPTVNEDLKRKGIQFLFETDGSPIIPLSSLTKEDVVIIPAFGASKEVVKELEEIGIDPKQYDTTCPFVTKVWKRGGKLAKSGHSLVIHGKHEHEETKATFSQNAKESPTVIVKNIEEAKALAACMLGEKSKTEFSQLFGHKSTPDFDPITDLTHFGVINQTTMLASETEEVMQILKEAAVKRFGVDEVKNHMADTKDTLCYATYENQTATLALAETKADVSFVLGGYNSSNTMHLVEILEKSMPTYHIRDFSEIYGLQSIRHFDQWTHQILETENWAPTQQNPITIALTSGASCPDILVDELIFGLLDLFEVEEPDFEKVIEALSH
jgi:4-hydroxy-3-methylbut-2-enyl diphosphate reductase